MDALSSVVQQKPTRALTPEVILIQSAGMERYLNRELARRLGIMAGAQFPFPRAFMRHTLDRVLGKSSGVDAYERQLLSWLLFDELARPTDDPAVRTITAQFKPDEGAARRLYFAERLAHLYDQYLTYRPEMLLSWEEQPAPHWQATLWRNIVGRLGGEHFARRCQRLLSEVDDERLQLHLPERILLFGGAGLPPLYLQMLARMARAVPVHVFCLSISEQYFHDFTGVKQAVPDPSVMSHPLLVSMGQVGGDFQFLLESLTTYQEALNRHVRHESESARVKANSAPSAKRKNSAHADRQLALFAEPQPAISPRENLIAASSSLTTLQLLQDSLLDGTLENLSAGESERALDESVTIDVCHSRQREVETLHDRLLGWFQADASLRPEDVVVLAPNIEDYVALIDAVFSARAGERSLVPYRVFDRTFRHQDPAARVLILGLTLLSGRFKVGDVLDLLQLDPVRARYQLSASDLERITEWLSQVNIRSGVDAAHRRHLGLPAFDENSWRFGLRRLLLGFAVPDDDSVFDDVVPHDDVAAADGLVLGKLCEFCEQVFALRKELVDAGETGLPLKAWSTFLSRLASALIGESTNGSWDLGALLQSLYAMEERRQALDGILGDPGGLLLGHEAMHHLLENELAQARYSADFLAGGVTFCSLLPLRNVPFRRVCVLGLNQGQFPRTDSSDPLNLMLASRRPGDRSLRADDRYLFVELLLSAREQISLSYVGRSIQDNSPIPPSVVLTELKAAVERLAGGSRGILQRVHPLQPFHPDYFSEDSGLRATSFDGDYYRGAQALVGQLDERSAFLQGALPLTPLDEELPLAELVRSFRDPALHYLRRLGVNPQVLGQTLLEREPIKVDALQEHILGEHLLTAHSERGHIDPAIELRRGQWPVGQGGTVLLHQLSRGTEAILRTAKTLRGNHAQRRALVEVALHGTISARCAAIFDHAPQHQHALHHYQDSRSELLLSGTVAELYGRWRVVVTYGRSKTRRKLKLFIEHVALCSAETAFDGSVLLCRGNQEAAVDVLAYRAISAARAKQILADLSGLFYLGRHAPLPYFPEWSASFADKLRSELDRDPEGAVERALDGTSGEEEERRPGFKQLFRELDPKLAAGAADLSAEQQPFVRMALFMDELMQELHMDLTLPGAAEGGDP